MNPTTPDANRTDATPLERFIDVLQGQRRFGVLTDSGIAELRRHARIALPYLPAIIASGGWSDWTDSPTIDAITAIVDSTPPPDSGDPALALTDTRESEACYMVGLLTGLALAHALAGAALRGDGR